MSLRTLTNTDNRSKYTFWTVAKCTYTTTRRTIPVLVHVSVGEKRPANGTARAANEEGKEREKGECCSMGLKLSTVCVSKRKLSHRTMSMMVTNGGREKSGKKEPVLFLVSDFFGLNSQRKLNGQQKRFQNGGTEKKARNEIETFLH